MKIELILIQYNITFNLFQLKINNSRAMQTILKYIQIFVLHAQIA